MFDEFDTSSLADYMAQYAQPDPYGGASGMSPADQIAFLAANGLTDAEIINTNPTLAEAGGLTGVGGGSIGTDWLGKLLGAAKGIGGKAIDAATSRGGMAGLAALLSYLDRQKPSGGGAGAAYAGYKPLNRTVTQGRYGPVAQYAAQGGLMQAYAQGGAVQPFPMQDGGFVMTKRAVDGAGGHGGLQQRIPEAVPIQGPGHGTSDSIPAYIQGPRGQTPAKVSNGEAYIPPGRNTQGLYALMKQFERKA